MYENVKHTAQAAQQICVMQSVQMYIARINEIMLSCKKHDKYKWRINIINSN
jgi:hypothetical protein